MTSRPRPAAKETARRNVVAALNGGGWGGKLMAVRVNDATTRWAYRDVAEVVTAAGRGLDVIMLPKVTDPGHVIWLDLLPVSYTHLTLPTICSV